MCRRMQLVSISGSLSTGISALPPTNLKIRHRETQKSHQQSRANASLRAAGHRRKKRSGMKRRIWAGQYSISESHVNSDLSRTTKAILEVVNARAPFASCSPGFVTGAGSAFLCAAAGEDFADRERLVLYLPGSVPNCFSIKGRHREQLCYRHAAMPMRCRSLAILDTLIHHKREVTGHASQVYWRLRACPHAVG